MIWTSWPKSQKTWRKWPKSPNCTTSSLNYATNAFYYKSWVKSVSTLKNLRILSRRSTLISSLRTQPGTLNWTTLWTGQWTRRLSIIPSPCSWPRGMLWFWFYKVSNKPCWWTRPVVTKLGKGISKRWAVWFRPWSSTFPWKVLRSFLWTLLTGSSWLRTCK